MDQKRRQRAQERICCSTEIVINDSIVCRALDVSEGGMFVMTDHPFATGNIVKLLLDTGKEKIEIKARVKHIAEGLGLGLMFIDLNDTVKKKIREFVQGLKNMGFSSR